MSTSSGYWFLSGGKEKKERSTKKPLAHPQLTQPLPPKQVAKEKHRIQHSLEEINWNSIWENHPLGDNFPVEYHRTDLPLEELRDKGYSYLTWNGGTTYKRSFVTLQLERSGKILIPLTDFVRGLQSTGVRFTVFRFDRDSIEICRVLESDTVLPSTLFQENALIA